MFLDTKYWETSVSIYYSYEFKKNKLRT